MVLADRIQLLLKTERIERLHREADKDVNPVGEHPDCIGERVAHFRLGPSFRGGVGHAPVSGHWLSRPHGTGLGGGVIAEGESEIELGAVRTGEFGPALGAKSAHVEVQPLEEFDCIRMYVPFGMAASRERVKAPLSRAIEDRFGHN